MKISRRDFISLLGGTAVWPAATRAQSRELLTIGFLHTATIESYISNAEGFAAGLKERGFAEAQNLAIEYRVANGRRDQLRALAADLVDRRVALIVAGGASAALAAKRATAAIPIVAVTGADPVRLGLVASLDQPGGNVTGVSPLNVEVGPKRLELARELMPATDVALLLNPSDP